MTPCLVFQPGSQVDVWHVSSNLQHHLCSVHVCAGHDLRSHADSLPHTPYTLPNTQHPRATRPERFLLGHPGTYLAARLAHEACFVSISPLMHLVIYFLLRSWDEWRIRRLLQRYWRMLVSAEPQGRTADRHMLNDGWTHMCLARTELEVQA